jgi:hypothetical protein
MKYLLIRHKSDEVRHSLIKLSGLKALTSSDKPRAQSSTHDYFIGPARHCGFPSLVAIDPLGPRAWVPSGAAV